MRKRLLALLLCAAVAMAHADAGTGTAGAGAVHARWVSRTQALLCPSRMWMDASLFLRSLVEYAGGLNLQQHRCPILQRTALCRKMARLSPIRSSISMPEFDVSMYYP
jgi:hypothetical protein